MESTIITIVGISVGFLQGIGIYILSGIKKDQADIWKRMNSHYHEVSCENTDCRMLKTGNVIIPQGRNDERHRLGSANIVTRSSP